MALIEYADLEQRSPEWFEVRRGIVTGSVVGKLLTPTLKVADNDTARGITAGLVAERITGQVDEISFLSDDMVRGIEHEPIARDRYAETEGVTVRECGFLRRDEDDWTLGYSPDGLIGSDGLLEVKCPRAKTHIRTILARDVPTYHMAQLQAGLLVTDREWVDYVSFCAGLPLYVKRVYPDAAWHEAIIAACQKFETTAAEMVAAYEDATKDLPATERVDNALGLVF